MCKIFTQEKVTAFLMTSGVKRFNMYCREEFANLHGHRVNYRNTVKKLSTLQSKIEGWEVNKTVQYIMHIILCVICLVGTRSVYSLY